MLLIKNDPQYNEQWPRPLVSYERVYGVKEPRRLAHRNDGKASPHLPEGTPFGLVGTSSFYKRESAPLGSVPEGGVTSVAPEDPRGPESSAFTGSPWNWKGQGADAGRYENSDIHAVRIVAFEPNAHTNAEGNRGGYPAYHNHPMERLRILGEIPLRKFGDKGASEPLDPDGNPDTSFLAKIPADVAFTFQTIDKHGMVLNMAQTWHQVRPGEKRYDCGGCHAHSQQPTLFEDTRASRDDYELFDLTKRTPLVTAQAADQSGRQWDQARETGIRYVEGPHDVEYFRDIQPLLARSCTACHSKTSDEPAAALVLDDDDTLIDGLPGTYFRLAADERTRFGPRKLEQRGNGELVVRDRYHWANASHYVWTFQSRRSLLVWKIFGGRLDGWTNDDIASESIEPGDPRRAKLVAPRGDQPGEGSRLYLGDVDYTGSAMPPPAAVAGTYKGPDGQPIKVPPLSDEERRTIVRWIDLGCPIDLDPKYDRSQAVARSEGYLADDTRPTLALTYPQAGENAPLERILIGMHDYHAGLDLESFRVSADFAIDGVAAGENLAAKFTALPGNRWELRLAQPANVESGTLTVSIDDRAGNAARIERKFSSRPPSARR
jgi:hypothetical protein